MSAILKAIDLRFGYRPDQTVLAGVDFQAHRGTFTSILGPNGSGKTTLLRCLLGELPLAAGQVLLENEPLASLSPTALAKTLAYVPQFPQSAFTFTARQIAMMGRFAHQGVLGIPSEEDQKIVQLAMEMTDSAAFADRALGELSGGEAQRVMIARALAQQPGVLLLDEPTSHLDIRHQMTIYRMMQRLAHDWNIAVVCVSHDLNLASRFADELLVMKGGQVLASGPPERVINVDILSKAYDVEIELISQPGSALPIVQAK
jgi:iron complex transport system ATP-binding protein